MKNKISILFFLGCLCFFGPGCNKYDISQFDFPTWTAELLGPLAKSTLKMKDILDIQIPPGGVFPIMPNTEVIVEDTTDFQLVGEKLDVISIEGDFNTYVTNGYPCRGTFQAYFLDISGKPLDSLFHTGENNIMELPDIDSNTGRVKTPKESILKVSMDANRVEKIKNAGDVRFKLILTSSPNYYVEIDDRRDSIVVQIVGDLKIEYRL